MATLGRRTVIRATESLCIRSHAIRIIETSNYRVYWPQQPQREFHTTPTTKGFLGYLVGDHHHARVHKEIGVLLEDYDNALIRYYKDATQAYHRFYLSGARKDLLIAFKHIAALYRLTSRMETYINTNELLQRTALPVIFHESEVQQQADAFLEAIQEKYGEDEQYKYLIEQVKNEKIEPVSQPLKSARFAGFLSKIFNWVRDHELQQLREDYEHSKEIFENARSTGRRRDIDKALKEADRLENMLEDRYEGKLWHEEIVTGKIDPRLKRTEENLAALDELKGNIEECIAEIRKEFEAASKASGAENDNIK